MGAAARGGHGISAGRAATLATSPICAGATNWPGHVERPNCGTTVDDGRGCEKSRASFRFCGYLGIGVELASAEHRSGSVRSRDRCRAGSSRTPRPWPERRDAWSARFARSLADRSGSSTAAKSRWSARTQAVPTNSSAPVRRRPKSVRAHFCLPEALHLGLALPRTAARAHGTAGDGVTARPAGRWSEWPERDGDHGVIGPQSAWRSCRSSACATRSRRFEIVSADQIEAIHARLAAGARRDRHELPAAGGARDPRRGRLRGRAGGAARALRPGLRRGADQARRRAPSPCTPAIPSATPAIGEDAINFCLVGSAPNVSDLERGRRTGNFADYCNLLKLGQSLNICHLIGGYPVEPVDLPPATRHLDARRGDGDADATRTSTATRWARCACAMRSRSPGSPAASPRAAAARAVAVHRGQLQLAAAVRRADAGGRDRDGAARPAGRSSRRSRSRAPWRRSRSPARWCSRTPRRSPASRSPSASSPGCPVIYGGFTSNVDMQHRRAGVRHARIRQGDADRRPARAPLPAALPRLQRHRLERAGRPGGLRIRDVDLAVRAGALQPGQARRSAGSRAACARRTRSSSSMPRCCR